MAYKAKFRPLERLGPDGWRRFEPEQPELPLGAKA
jgi:arginine-tRNA-protein transferase